FRRSACERPYADRRHARSGDRRACSARNRAARRRDRGRLSEPAGDSLMAGLRRPCVTALVGALAVLQLAGCQPDDGVVPIYDSATVDQLDIQVSVEASGVIEPVRT